MEDEGYNYMWIDDWVCNFLVFRAEVVSLLVIVRIVVIVLWNEGWIWSGGCSGRLSVWYNWGIFDWLKNWGALGMGLMACYTFPYIIQSSLMVSRMRVQILAIAASSSGGASFFLQLFAQALGWILQWGQLETIVGLGARDAWIWIYHSI